MRFEDCIDLILSAEGGYVNDPRDPGGETKFGISRKVYPGVDIKNLTREAAMELYRKDFWEKCKIASLPPYLRYIVLDAAINQGPTTCIFLLQNVLGAPADGFLGPETLASVFKSNPTRTLGLYAKARLTRYTNDPRWSIYGPGWSQRLLQVAIIAGTTITV